MELSEISLSAAVSKVKDEIPETYSTSEDRPISELKIKLSPDDFKTVICQWAAA